MRASLVAVTALALGLGGCGPAADAPQTPVVTAGEAITGSVLVFAAASLTETFERLAEDFEAEHPGVQVHVSFAGSATLAAQIVEGAPVDVFASASTATMDAVLDAGLADGALAVFATNELTIAVPSGNPGDVRSLEDFARGDLVLAVCAVEVPCGAAAATVFEAAGVQPVVDTVEQDVKAVLTKVELGEVDAGLVYVTDAASAADAVESIPFPSSAAAITDYPIVRLSAAPNPDAAAAFIAFVLSEHGSDLLEDAGFGAP